jgi:hypothetical protein
MDDIVLLVTVIIVILLLLANLSPKTENMVNEMNWYSMSRGLNASNVNGYAPVIKTLSTMELTNAAGITA